MKNSIHLYIVLVITTSAFSQTFNQEIQIKEGSPILAGKINFQKLNTTPYDTWFSENYNTYTPNKEFTKLIKSDIRTYTIKIFMGTWCGDSKREVPAFYKILEACDFPLERVTTIAVQADREHYKQSPGGEHEGLNIHRVPTFIFYKNGQEIQRIVESPKTSLEEDVHTILSGNYTPNYVSVSKMDALLSTQSTDYLSQNTENLISEFREITENVFELNTYANVLFYARKEEKAMAVLKFNTLLFPKEATAYVSLAHKLRITQNTTDAIQYYERSLTLEKNKKVKKIVNELKKSLR